MQTETTLIATFRHITGGHPTHYTTIAKKYIPETIKQVTITIVIPETWKTGKPLHGHLAKTIGKSTIHNSYKIIINKPLVEKLQLQTGKLVWIRITPFTPNPPPPPPTPYIYKPVRVHCDGSSYFFTISAKTIDTLREITPGRNLRVTTNIGNKTITYIKRPIKLSDNNEQLYKILLPSSIFEGLIHRGMQIPVKIETTDEDES